MFESDVLFIAIVVLGYGVISGRIQRTHLTAPMLFTMIGFVAGGDVLGLFTVDLTDDVVRVVMEIALVLVLFTDATRIDIGLLRERFRLPLRLLGIGMPLIMLAGLGVALLLFPQFTVWEALVVAVILAPTDAALGQVVVTSKAVPPVVRQSLNVESGLNDGLALPVLTFAVAATVAEGEAEGVAQWLAEAAAEIAIAVVVGVLVGHLGGLLVSKATESRWMSPPFQRLAALGLALAAYSATIELHGSGFIAAFVAGLTLGALNRPLCECLFDFAEAEGQLLLLITFLFFGAAAVGPAIGAATWQTVVYAVASLTVVRLIPVLISIWSRPLTLFTKLFIGWFGPRGIASIIFGVLVLGDSSFGVRSEVFNVVAFTVVLSIVAHGLTARPAANWYAREMESMADEHDTMDEFGFAPDLPMRPGMSDE